jgi:hypothetical protein
MIKIIVAGGRNYTDMAVVEAKTLEFIHQYYSPFEIEIVSGGAFGADKMGERVAYKYSYSVKLFLPDWQKYGPAAGPIRNREMAEYADVAVVFWDGKSKGTKNMISEMKRLNKTCHVVTY